MRELVNSLLRSSVYTLFMSMGLFIVTFPFSLGILVFLAAAPLATTAVLGLSFALTASVLSIILDGPSIFTNALFPPQKDNNSGSNHQWQPLDGDKAEVGRREYNQTPYERSSTGKTLDDEDTLVLQIKKFDDELVDFRQRIGRAHLANSIFPPKLTSNDGSSDTLETDSTHSPG